MQGPLDVEAIRKVDAGIMTANQAFTKGGILSKIGRSCLEDCSNKEKAHALEILALFASMEIASLILLLRDLGEQKPRIFLAGSPASLIEKRVSELLERDVRSLERCTAAIGCAYISKDVYFGARSILGLMVDLRAHFRE